MSFQKLGLSKLILRAINEQSYTTPSPIQQKAIPVILSKKDVLAGAQTGTGKTAGFTLPLLENMLKHNPTMKKHQIRALILTPTRELAAQVGESVSAYSKYLHFKSAVIFGGVGINPQKLAIKKGVDILTATPGRLLDLVEQKALDLSRVEYLILDEADRMLDMGFIHDIKKVLALLPHNRQNMLFSATFSESIKKLADSLLKSPVLIEVARANTSSEMVTQKVYMTDKVKKRELLTKLIKDGNWSQVLVFTRTKHGADKLSKQLISDGINAAPIHGGKTQSARTKALASFKQGSVKVLVATDIAARGIDISQLPHVVNFELPNVSEDYVHRIGRTGRAGNEGEAISIVCIDEEDFLRDIEKLINKKIPQIKVAGFEPDPKIPKEPVMLGRNSQKRVDKPKINTPRADAKPRSRNSHRGSNDGSRSNKERKSGQRRGR